MKKIIKSICPPVLWGWLSAIGRTTLKKKSPASSVESNKIDIIENPLQQDLDLYWTDDMAKVLDEWGEDNVWNEIQLLLANCEGKVLDIACGTGKTIALLKKFDKLEIHGCDISELLIQKGIERGLSAHTLKVCDATKTEYLDNEFKYSYSIGSLEHFTSDGIDDFIKESYRITSIASFHMIPTSKSQQNEGWMKTVQSFFNNSDDWWMKRYKKYYPKVEIVNSKWNDNISFGKWFICYK